MGNFVQHLHLIGFCKVFSLQTRAKFVLGTRLCVSLLCRLGLVGGSLRHYPGHEGDEIPL